MSGENLAYVPAENASMAYVPSENATFTCSHTKPKEESMHDANGVELKVGDRVILEAVIDTLQSGEDFCNATLKSVLGRKPDGAKETFCMNTAVCVKVPTGK